MKLYLKSGQVVKLNELHTIKIKDYSFGVGKYYDEAVDDSKISKTMLCEVCSQSENVKVEFYYDVTKMFCTNTGNIVGLEV